MIPEGNEAGVGISNHPHRTDADRAPGLFGDVGQNLGARREALVGEERAKNSSAPSLSLALEHQAVGHRRHLCLPRIQPLRWFCSRVPCLYGLSHSVQYLPPLWFAVLTRQSSGPPPRPQDSFVRIGTQRSGTGGWYTTVTSQKPAGLVRRDLGRKYISCRLVGGKRPGCAVLIPLVVLCGLGWIFIQRGCGPWAANGCSSSVGIKRTAQATSPSLDHLAARLRAQSLAPMVMERGDDDKREKRNVVHVVGAEI